MESQSILPERTSQLISLVKSSKLECIVCLSVLTPVQPVYSCKICYTILHIFCFNSWIANSPTCPACSSALSVGVQEYRCFCGKVSNPESSKEITPHACSEICGKKLSTCAHKCSLPCHPGSCEKCPRTSTKTTCFCGALSYIPRCIDKRISCGGKCYRELNCDSGFF
jgi:transcriptional repressor NF-X1